MPIQITLNKDKMELNQHKIWFLQLARILACLLVVYTHWYGLLTNPQAIANMLFPHNELHFSAALLNEYLGIFSATLGLNHFSSVHFGLGLFFILSGYVIPLSLKKTNPRSYLIRRLFRIYPTVIVCIILASLVMILTGYYLGATPPHFLRFKVIISNLLLFRDLMNVPFIEYSTWTLEIEMHFYLIFFLLFYYQIEKKPASFLILASILVIAYQISYGLPHEAGWIRHLNKILSVNSIYLGFMFIGTSIYYTLSKQWSYTTGILSAIFLLALNYLSLHINQDSDWTGSEIFVNHLYVLVFFLLLSASNPYLPYSKILSGLANISYPLYLTHGFIGYSYFLVFYHKTGNLWFSAVSSLGLVLLTAYLIHRYVENKGIEFSKKLVRKMAHGDGRLSSEAALLSG
ncbi:acyltransferase [Legionella birminghamensis]|uniref:Acyltransferase n=1 Tax=Legionella birminghamensis TaxID=28083 RepID=A0A378I8N5_9GAMM|nr:acyltransferase [Legionella birminghamensis]KTC69315.1 acyltransferase [Legionella birminghamensis]STX31577.1 acyltransferase [Legionella birminghamensis]